MTFIDDCTKFCYVYLLKSKDETIEKFVMYKNEVENQLNRRIKRIRSDRGGEYIELFSHSALNMVSFTKLHHHTLLNQIVWPKEKIEHLKK